MKQQLLTAAAVLALTLAGLPAASAVEFDVGPGGVHVGPGYHHDRYYRDYGRECRIVIEHHTNRYGEDVTVRRRICD